MAPVRSFIEENIINLFTTLKKSFIATELYEPIIRSEKPIPTSNLDLLQNSCTVTLFNVIYNRKSIDLNFIFVLDDFVEREEFIIVRSKGLKHL